MQPVKISTHSLDHTAADAFSAEHIGAKAANLAIMARLGLPIPPAFVIPLGLCQKIIARKPKAKADLERAIADGIAFLEEQTGRKFGGRHNPLLVSVRSGAARSMPGMLDTVLNVGCTWAAVRGLIRTYGNPRLAWDSRRRFLQSFGETVAGIPAKSFDDLLGELCARERAASEQQLDSAALEQLARSYHAVVADAVPEDPVEQLVVAAQAVFRSWTSERAVAYRRIQHLEDLTGTAVTVQAMVFGNSGPRSAAGVAFSRNPSTGDPRPVIDVLVDAQGEDVVSGRITPVDEEVLDRKMPAAAQALRTALVTLERKFRDVQDVEFTVEEQKLWLLQTRAAKRTPRAAVRLAHDLVKEGVVSRREAIERIRNIDIQALQTLRLVASGEPAARGYGASDGVAVGRAAFDAAGVARFSAAGEPCILVRSEISTADVVAFEHATGIVTVAGGRTAHAALVARQLGKPCVVGCGNLRISEAGNAARLGEGEFKEGDWLSIDARTGDVFIDRLSIEKVAPAPEVLAVSKWLSSERRKSRSPRQSRRTIASATTGDAPAIAKSR